MTKKSYTVRMFRVYGPVAKWTCQATSLADAARQFALCGDRDWMNAFVSLDGGKGSYNVQSFSDYWSARRQA